MIERNRRSVWSWVFGLAFLPAVPMAGWADLVASKQELDRAELKRQQPTRLQTVFEGLSADCIERIRGVHAAIQPVIDEGTAKRSSGFAGLFFVGRTLVLPLPPVYTYWDITACRIGAPTLRSKNFDVIPLSSSGLRYDERRWLESPWVLMDLEMLRAQGLGASEIFLNARVTKQDLDSAFAAEHRKRVVQKLLKNADRL